MKHHVHQRHADLHKPQQRYLAPVPPAERHAHQPQQQQRAPVKAVHRAPDLVKQRRGIGPHRVARRQPAQFQRAALVLLRDDIAFIIQPGKLAFGGVQARGNVDAPVHQKLDPQQFGDFIRVIAQPLQRQREPFRVGLAAVGVLGGHVWRCPLYVVASAEVAHGVFAVALPEIRAAGGGHGHEGLKDAVIADDPGGQHRRAQQRHRQQAQDRLPQAAAEQEPQRHQNRQRRHDGPCQHR